MLDLINKISRRNLAIVAVSLISGFILSRLPGFLRQCRRKAEQLQGLRIGIQLGGTNFHVAVYKYSSEESNAILELCKKYSGATSNPQDTITEITDKINQLVNQLSQERPLPNGALYYIKFIGIASFGPLCLNLSKQEFGSIMNTPKQSWRNYPLLKQIQEKFPTAITKIDTDVNASAIAEYNYNKAQRGIASLAYITVGTGVGVGIIANNRVVHGLTHPEGGHIMVKLHPDEEGVYQNFPGVCIQHRNCLEGLVCSEAIARRLRTTIDQLADVENEHAVWNLVGYYLAQLCLNLTLIASPQMIVVGGGVLNRRPLLNYIHDHFRELLNKYVEHPLLEENLKDYIKLSEVRDVGCRGALELERSRD